MFDLSGAISEALVLMLVAAVIGAFIVFLLLKPRLDKLIVENQRLRKSGAQGTAASSSGSDDAELKGLKAALDECSRERKRLTQRVSTLEARYEDTKQQLALAQERLSTAPTPMVGGDDREHESIQNLVQTADSQQTPPKAKPSGKKPKEDKTAVLDRIRAKARNLDFGRIGTATATEKDDLKRIKGIGPFIEEKLNALGIYTFRQLAKLTPEDEEKVSDAIEFFPGRIQRDGWVQQARTLAGEPEDKETQALRRVQGRAKEINFGRIGTASPRMADDLKRIKGIGPFIEKKLNAIGIYTFAQISRFTPEDDEKVNEVIEFFPGRIRRDDWRGQAEKLAQEEQKK